MPPDKIGIIAGEGKPPMYVAQGARALGRHVTILGIEDITSPDIEQFADAIHWFKLGRFSRMIKICKSEGINHVAMIGRINQKLSLNPLNYDLRSILVMMNLPDFKPKSIFKAVEQELAQEGIEILDTRPYLQQYIPKPGFLTRKRSLMNDEEEAIRFGYPIAKWLADAEIGQTIVVDRRKAVIAVEAIEGTNGVLERVGQLHIKDSITIKVSRTQQDFRFDIPAIGLTTIQKIKSVGGAALAMTAGEMLFFQMEESIQLAEESGICIVAVDDQQYSPKTN
ncbi:UDP-2,3-diacylglucosamine diphosphatase LpxI [Candidatus Sumerlaeota bacterium]|nr:UDP-2,3-diacylglucosamine diphosphatase LpxI [Candidatus Sumerlaeota bacterium]